MVEIVVVISRNTSKELSRYVPLYSAHLTCPFPKSFHESVGHLKQFDKKENTLFIFKKFRIAQFKALQICVA